jgi:hypothetical protein
MDCVSERLSVYYKGFIEQVVLIRILPAVFLLFFTGCYPLKKRHNIIQFKNYKVLYDGQKNGYGTITGTLVKKDDEWIGLFSGGGKYQDDEIGMRPFLIKTKDYGSTWTEPVPFAENLLLNPKRESINLGIFGPTKKGTLITRGFHYQGRDSTKSIYEDTEWRTYKLIIGRKVKDATDFTYKSYPSGTFLGEQFMEGGLQLPSGRMIFSIWGAKNKGENWRCGVLISDDDGVSWRYRDVAYEPDLKIRDKPEISAGFNEQTMFVTRTGKIVSIIRGRAKLGRVLNSPSDTWFFRSESTDGGQTWSKYELTNVAGTGAAAVGLTLPDGSLLFACRVPYSRDLYKLEEPDLYGLHFARSFDEGKTWQSEKILQRDPAGNPFTSHYNAMNGQFIKLSGNEWLYQFGQFDVKKNIYRILSCNLVVK